MDHVVDGCLLQHFRVDDSTCGVKVEYVPWAETSSKFTLPFEDHAGYLAQRADKTTLSELMRIAWATVGAIIRRVVARLGDRDILDDLTHVGVDELSYPERCAKLEAVTIDMAGANIQAVTECSPQAN